MPTSLAPSLSSSSTPAPRRAPAEASPGPRALARHAVSPHAAEATIPAPRRLRSHELLDGEREIEIEHAGAVYRLRRTSLGKLILTK